MAPPRLPLLLLVAAAAIGADPDPGPLRVPERCLEPRAVGRCRGAVPRWWFNASAAACQPFVFGGCDANGNNFPTERRCRRSCAPGDEDGASNELPLPSRRADAGSSGRRSEPGNGSSSYAEACLAPRVTGPCRAAFPRWYYSADEAACRRFLYGGCRGNANNYARREECWRRCGHAPGDGAAPAFPLASVKTAVLAALLAALAAVLLGSALRVAGCRRSLRSRRAAAAGGAAEDKERLVGSAEAL
ncbi:kunitz-type protease inhibitor 2 [Eudromia elegans]